MRLQTVQNVACEIILQHPSFSAAQIAELVRQRLPNCKCREASIAWYKAKLKSGEIIYSTKYDDNTDLLLKYTKKHVVDVDNKSEFFSIANPKLRSKWPDFGQISDEEMFELALLTTRHICFLSPDIIRVLVEDNERRRDGWSRRLTDRGVDPNLYLWPNSPCAFPGVRRYAGSEEIATYRGQNKAARWPKNALALDDNTYPKQIWSFVFQGKKFGNLGPLGYALAHLVDHKEYKNRMLQECGNNNIVEAFYPIFGLFSSPTNTVYMPTGLMRPTDFSFPLRNLMQRKAEALYGAFCNLLPPHLPFKAGVSNRWALDAFDWQEPVGSMDHVRAFLDYRNESIEKLLASPLPEGAVFERT